MYLRYKEANLSFKIDEEKMEIVAIKFINNKRYKMVKKLTTNSITYLWKVLDNLAKLPEEFWKLDI